MTQIDADEIGPTNDRNTGEVEQIIEDVVKVLRDDRKGILKEGEFNLRINRLVREFMNLAERKSNLPLAERDYMDQVMESLKNEEV